MLRFTDVDTSGSGIDDRQTERVRPGMEGIGKIEVNQRRLISIYTRDLVNWAKLWLWTWWPGL